MFLKQKDSVPGWPLIAFTILLATSVGIVGCTSSSRMDSSEAGQDEAQIRETLGPKYASFSGTRPPTQDYVNCVPS